MSLCYPSEYPKTIGEISNATTTNGPMTDYLVQHLEEWFVNYFTFLTFRLADDLIRRTEKLHSLLLSKGLFSLYLLNLTCKMTYL